jgi:hypothetical protein
VIVSFHIPVNPADNVHGHLNTTKYTAPLSGAVRETIPVPYLFVVILGSQVFEL